MLKQYLWNIFLSIQNSICSNSKINEYQLIINIFYQRFINLPLYKLHANITHANNRRHNKLFALILINPPPITISVKREYKFLFADKKKKPKKRHKMLLYLLVIFSNENERKKRQYTCNKAINISTYMCEATKCNHLHTSPATRRISRYRGVHRSPWKRIKATKTFISSMEWKMPQRMQQHATLPRTVASIVLLLLLRLRQ